MWWCSTLVEKHPKVTHNLFPALKLRTLELLLDEKGRHQAGTSAPRRGRPCGWKTSWALLQGYRARVRRAPYRQRGSGSAEGAESKLKACYYRLPAPVKALVRFPAWLWIVRRRPPRTPLSRPALPEGVKPASIVTYFPNIDMAAAKGTGGSAPATGKSSMTPSSPPTASPTA